MSFHTYKQEERALDVNGIDNSGDHSNELYIFIYLTNEEEEIEQNDNNGSRH